MICPICKREPEDLAHAYDHIRKEEAYGIYAYDPATASSTLVLHPIKGRLTMPEVGELRKRLGKWEQFIYGSRLRIIEQSQTFVRWKIN